MVATTAVTLQTIGSSMEAYGNLEAGKFNNEVAQLNAYYADLQAQDAIVRGNEVEALARTRTRLTIGEQRATLAAQNVELDSGTPLHLQQDVAEIGEIEALTIRNNAQREAFGYRIQAQNFRLEGELAEFGGKVGAISSLFRGGARTASFYNR